jgi:predicted nucleotidyltransferase
MPQQELLKKVIQVLENNGIEYMVTGSVVSSLQGEPRSTHDIDIIVAVQKSAVKQLIEAFPAPDFYLDENSILGAITSQTMFNLIDVSEGDKVDFWILTDEPFDRSRFSRKYAEEALGIRIQVSSPEDTILAKLRWAKLSGGSEKHFTDALRVYEVQSERLDQDYLEEWAKKLDVESMWERLKGEAEIV